MRLRLILMLLVVGLLHEHSFAQLRPWPDTVTFYRQGPNATPGYDSTNPYFPNNVLGPPDSTATGSSPAFTPQELQALGTGGEIILKYNGRVIVNGPGPDFTVFENPFLVGGDSNNVFREVGIVSVSRDGVAFTEFPFQGAPVWRNLAGSTPTYGGNPLDPEVSGGDKFDLAEIGMDSVQYVKIVDAAARVPDNGPSFDLDAVATLHLVSTVTAVSRQEQLLPASICLEQNYPNPFNPTTTIVYEVASGGHVRLDVFDLLGQKLVHLVDERQPTGRYMLMFNASGLPSGILYYRLTVGAQSLTRRMILLQ